MNLQNRKAFNVIKEDQLKKQLMDQSFNYFKKDPKYKDVDREEFDNPVKNINNGFKKSKVQSVIFNWFKNNNSHNPKKYFLTHEQIARFCNCSVSYVEKIVRELKESNFLFKEKNTNGQKNRLMFKFIWRINPNVDLAEILKKKCRYFKKKIKNIINDNFVVIEEKKVNKNNNSLYQYEEDELNIVEIVV